MDDVIFITLSQTKKIGREFGKNDDKCKVVDIIKKVKEVWLKHFHRDCVASPTNDDIRIIQLKKPLEKIILLDWEDGSDREECRSPAFCHPTKKKIILAIPFDKKLSYCRTLAHEVGHWFFDREFDKYGKRPSNSEHKVWDDHGRKYGRHYEIYSEAVAMYIDEEIFGKHWTENNVSKAHIYALENLRKYQKIYNEDALKFLVEKYECILEENKNGFSWP